MGMHAVRPRRRTSVFAAVGAVALLVGTLTPAASASAAVYAAQPSAATVSDIAADADWLLQGQLPDGAIAWYIDKAHVSPYQANYAAVGLAEATRQTGDPTYLQAAWSWLNWYASHEDANGFVTDYDVSNGVETSTGDEDSTDAYAGTFLSAVGAAYAVGGSRTRLRQLHAGIAGAVSAIEATQDADGLTWAKPSWHVKYLMDQTEAYAGLRSAAELADVLHDGSLRTRALADADAMQAGIAGLWDDPTAAYDWAENDAGAVNVTDWTQLYPDAMEQAWIAGSPAISTDRAAGLMAEVQADQPNWASPDAQAQINGSTSVVGYWPVAGWALLRLGDYAGAAAAASSIRAAAVTDGRPWPFTTGDAGELIVLESGDPSLITP